MLDMGVYNLLSMQSFHGVWAGNVQECLLKSHIGKASIMVLALITVRATTPAVYPSARRGGLRGAGGRSTDARSAANIDCGF
jgi:hypothetical protein